MLDELKKILLEYYGDNIPKSTAEYIANYPTGYSRQAILKKYGLKTSEIVSLINPQYTKADAKVTLVENLNRLGYVLDTELPESYSSKDKVKVKCKLCSYVNDTTLDSLRGSTKGCIRCLAGNLPWSKRQKELEQTIFEEFDGELVSNIPSSQTGYISIKHLPCGNIYTTQLVGVVSPNSTLRGTCPSCRSTDRRVVYNYTTFGSQFELDCYKLLEHLNPEVHVPYSKYLNTSRKWVCDFKIGSIWIEVSSFKTDYKNYFSNLEEKRNIVEQSGFIFFFFNSLKDLQECVSLINTKI